MINSIAPKFAASCCQFSSQQPAKQPVQAPKFQQTLNQGLVDSASAYRNDLASQTKGVKLNVVA